jgi:hypothetical protein
MSRFGMGDQIVGILFMLSILTDLLLHLAISMTTFLAFIAIFFATWLGCVPGMIFHFSFHFLDSMIFSIKIT